MAKITTLKLQEMKEKGEKISMTTAYDYPTALLAEKAGIEIILVGDSLMMAVLGDDSTVSCTIDQMIYHIKPVVLGAPTPLIVGDLPFGSYNESKEQAVRNATRLMKEGRCDVIKLEGGKEIADTVKAIVDAGVPVMGHIGGIYGKVVRVKDEQLIIQVGADKTRIEIARWAISKVVSEEPASSKPVDKDEPKEKTKQARPKRLEKVNSSDTESDPPENNPLESEEKENNPLEEE
jgi:hypothetical protein